MRTRPALLLFSALTALSLVALPRAADADQLRPGSGDYGSITSIAPGINELGIESLFVLNYGKADGSSSTRVTLVGGAVYRRFISENLNLSLNVGGLYRLTDEAVSASSAGVIGTV